MARKKKAGGCCHCNPVEPCFLCNATEHRKNLRVQIVAGYPTPCEYDFEIECFPNNVVVQNIISQSYTHLKRVVISVQMGSPYVSGECISVNFYQEHKRLDIVNPFGIVLTQSEEVHFVFKPGAGGDGCAHNRYSHFPCTIDPSTYDWSCSGINNELRFIPQLVTNSVLWQPNNLSGTWPDPPICLTSELDAGKPDGISYHITCTLSWVDP